MKRKHCWKIRSRKATYPNRSVNTEKRCFKCDSIIKFSVRDDIYCCKTCGFKYTPAQFYDL